MNDARFGSRPRLDRLYGLTLLSTFAVLTLGACSSDEDAKPATNMVGAGTGGTGGATGGSGGDTGGTGGATGGSGGTGGAGGATGGAGGAMGGSAGTFMTMEPRQPLPCFADEGTPAGSAINLDLAPSRIT